MEKNIEVKLNKKPSFTEAWFEGSVVYDGQEHSFWLVDPQSEDEEGHKYECEVKWFFKSVPKEVRGSYASIIEMYKKIHYDDSSNSTRDTESI